jgi:YVTN family beta-propeller protein
MSEQFVDEAELRDALELALVSEPPLGPVVHGAVRAGMRRRRRRRMTGIAAGLAVVCAAVLVLPGLTGRHAARPVTPVSRATVFVATLAGPRSLVTPISAATGKAGRPAGVGPWVNTLAVTPDGKTVYAVDQETDSVIPVSVATGAAGRAIKVAGIPFSIVITRDGKTAFVYGEKSTLTPVTLATGRTGKPIFIPPAQMQTGLSATPVLSRDGRTIYVTPTVLKVRTLVPVDVASRRAEKPIGLKFRPDVVVLSPDGKTLYLVNTVAGTVAPLVVATRRVGRPIKVGTGPVALAATPDGRTAFVVNRDSGTVTPIDVASGRPLPAIKVGRMPMAIAITPDGKTAYVVNSHSQSVTPIQVATDRALPAIKIRGYPDSIAMAPDGRTAYVISSAAAAGSISRVGVVTAIDTRTQAARVVSTVAGEPVAIAIAP